MSMKNLLYLNDDVLTNIISFVSDVPYEQSDAGRSTFTHVLPLICKRFHTLCKTDYLWKEAIERLIHKKPLIWFEGVIDFLVRYEYSSITSSSMYSVISDMADYEEKTLNLREKMDRSFKKDDHSTVQALLNYAYETVVKGKPHSDQTHESIYENIFKWVVNFHVRFTSSVFVMRDSFVSIDSSVGLHFFEPRYRLMMYEVMLPFPAVMSTGAPCNFLKKPRFIYAYKGRISPGSQVAIVEVEQCTTHPDFRADVLLKVKAFARIENCWERPNTFGLYAARVCIF